MTKTINIAATISMILADKNSSFYQSSTDENQEVDQGKQIREAFLNRSVETCKTEDSRGFFTAVQSHIKKIVDHVKGGGKLTYQPRRNGKVLRGQNEQA